MGMIQSGSLPNFLNNQKALMWLRGILLHYTAFITTLATLGTTWEQYGQAWAQLGDHLVTTC